MSGKKGNDKGNQSRQDLAALRDARDAARMRVDYVAPPPQPHPNEQVTDDVKDKDKDKEREREKARKRSAHEEAMHVPAIAERYGLQSRPIGKGPDSEWVAGIVGGGPALPQATTASSEGGGQAPPDSVPGDSDEEELRRRPMRNAPGAVRADRDAEYRLIDFLPERALRTLSDPNGMAYHVVRLPNLEEELQYCMLQNLSLALLNQLFEFNGDFESARHTNLLQAMTEAERRGLISHAEAKWLRFINKMGNRAKHEPGNTRSRSPQPGRRRP